MLKKIKYLPLLSLLLALAAYLPPAFSYAQTPTDDFIVQLCEFRRMFCGTGAVVFITITVVFVGILTLMNKINWGFVLVMLAASIIFVNADKVVFLITSENVQCSC
ncbi:MAG TPA: hypothetical protein DIV86_05120 [Alphaproteobacteria bacterium]|nr:hypothetical protein [Alphaproteobacteria bacterium]